jgi:hypothetical protein
MISPEPTQISLYPHDGFYLVMGDYRVWEFCDFWVWSHAAAWDCLSRIGNIERHKTKIWLVKNITNTAWNLSFSLGYNSCIHWRI